MADTKVSVEKHLEGLPRKRGKAVTTVVQRRVYNKLYWDIMKVTVTVSYYDSYFRTV